MSIAVVAKVIDDLRALSQESAQLDNLGTPLDEVQTVTSLLASYNNELEAITGEDDPDPAEDYLFNNLNFNKEQDIRKLKNLATV